MHEGFVTYSEALFIERLFGKEAYKKTMELMTKKMQEEENYVLALPEKDTKLTKFERYNGYIGASFLDKLRTQINEDKVFFDILKSFQLKFRKKIITIDVFLTMVNEKTKKDFTKFFKAELY